MSPFEIVVVTLLVLGVVFAITLLAVRQMAAGRAQAARDRFPTAKLVIPGANFYGQESRGVAQMRGTGTLVLTNSELYFEKWLPRQEHRIPLAAIRALETPTRYLGKTNFRPLLKVVFQDEAGQTDSMGWLVPDVEGLKREIEAARP